MPSVDNRDLSLPASLGDAACPPWPNFPATGFYWVAVRNGQLVLVEGVDPDA
jgi:hypothetical protein